MKTLIEIHILQNFAPSNLNRDDTGAPKDALFGGTRRARVSSQCNKRAVRGYFRQKLEEGFFSEEELAVRTKRVYQAIVESLADKREEETEIMAKAKTALSYVKLKEAKKDKTQYLLFLGRNEIAGLAETINDCWDQIMIESGELGEVDKKKNKKEKAKSAPKEVKDRIDSIFSGCKSVDVALFGRMLADMPEKNQNAACQVAHAISTHVVEREFDYFTAVDDLKPEETAGSDMIGTIEFNSACFYRYAVVDWAKLVENLQGDAELAAKGLRAFLEGFAIAEPTGMQNSFAAHNPPELISIAVRHNTAPRNLANAFEAALRVKKHESLTKESTVCLSKKAAALDKLYGTPVNARYAVTEDLFGENFEAKGLGDKKEGIFSVIDWALNEVEKKET